MQTLKPKTGDRPSHVAWPTYSDAVSTGFTLVELMLALSIAVVLVGLIFSLYFAVSRTVNEQHDRRTGGTAMILALEQVTRDLVNATPVPGYDEGGFLLETEEGARGPASQLTFCSGRARRAPTGETHDLAETETEDSTARDLRWFEVWEISYRLEYAPRERGRLIRTERPIVGPESLEPPRTNVLATGVDQFHVQVRQDDDWTDTWTVDPHDEQATWPRAARITLMPDNRVRGGQTQTVGVLIPVGWTIERVEDKGP